MRQGIGRLLARTVLWPIIILRRQIPPPVVVGIGSFCGHNFLYMFAICNAARPRSVIRPRDSKSAQRCLFSSVQWLRFCRGERRCANRPSDRRFSVESIHPKQSDSSTTSMYGSHSPSGLFLPRYIAIQQHFSVAACCSNHALSCARSLYSNRSTISIIYNLVPRYPSQTFYQRR